MENLVNDDKLSSSFSVRRIPVSKTENSFDTENEKYKDKVKILELSNLIDEWEQELLFSEKGFYSFKGKEVENKRVEFITELEHFINSKISEMSFVLPVSRETANKIKQLKIDSIKQKMQSYESSELYNWEIDVYNKALEYSVKKAVSYINDKEVVSNCLKNGLSVLKLMAERENWSLKIIKSKKEKYLSDFYYSLIKAFLDKKDINFVLLFDKYKNFLLPKEKEEIEQAVNSMKNTIIAYNWANEIFTYNINDNEIEEEINKLNDSELETCVRNYIKVLKFNKDKLDNQKKKEESDKSWEDILSLLDSNPDKSFLYIDYNQGKHLSNIQKEYIKKIIKDGSIKTDKTKFIDLFEEMLGDFLTFQDKSLDDYRTCLSKEDFDFFSKFQKEDISKIALLKSDYNYISKLAKQSKNKDSDLLYDFISLYFSSLEEYKAINEKDADIEKRNKLIQVLSERINAEKNIEESKKELNKDDSIINNTRK